MVPFPGEGSGVEDCLWATPLGACRGHAGRGRTDGGNLFVGRLWYKGGEVQEGTATEAADEIGVSVSHKQPPQTDVPSVSHSSANVFAGDLPHCS